MEREAQTQDLLCKHHSLLRGLALLGKIASSRAGVEKVHESGISCAREQERTHRIMGTRQKDTETSFRKLPLDMSGII